MTFSLAGELQDQVVRKREQLRYAQRSEYIHNLRLYHHNMVEDVINFRRGSGLTDTAQINSYMSKRQAKPLPNVNTMNGANGVAHPQGVSAVTQNSGITTNVILNGFPVDGGFTSTLSGIPLSTITPNSITLSNSIAPKLPQIANVTTPATTITYIKPIPGKD